MQTTLPKQEIGRPATLGGTVRVLTQVLADEHVLYIKLRNYHWNVEGHHFRELHALFEEQYELIARRMNRVAERIRILGAKTKSTMTESLQQTALLEHPGSSFSAEQMLQGVLEDHETIVGFLRSSLASVSPHQLDVGSIDLLTALIQDHERMAWTVRATLTGSSDDHPPRKAERLSVLYE
jgi:starvation-inducible DNA-binding protein